MVIKKLRLKNFRNYSSEEILFSESVNLIYGENAQGKTNIIEALYLFATGKSHRTNNTNELIRYGESFFDIILEFEEDDYYQTIEIKYEKGRGKQLSINDVKRDRMSDLLGVVPSVLFAPESLLYVKGSPGERRKILDIVLCQMNKQYLTNLQKYNRIVKNKNIILKKNQLNMKMDDQIEIWSESQAKTGSVIIEERRKLIENLENRMNRLMLGISEGKEKISIKYKSVFNDGVSIYDTLLETICRNGDKEKEQGSCIIGPHRDDIEIYVNNKNSRVYCSQGQQRSVALALNIAILEEIGEQTEKTPILLLDDVMSELDGKRQKYLFDLIKNRQTILTSTEKEKFFGAEDQDVSCIKIKEGRIIENAALLT